MSFAKLNNFEKCMVPPSEEVGNCGMPSLGSQVRVERPNTLNILPVLTSSNGNKNPNWKIYVNDDLHKQPPIPPVRSKIKTNAVVNFPSAKKYTQTVNSDSKNLAKQDDCSSQHNSNVICYTHAITPSNVAKPLAENGLENYRKNNEEFEKMAKEFGSGVGMLDRTTETSHSSEMSHSLQKKNNLSPFTKIIKQSQQLFLGRAGSASPEPLSRNGNDFVDTGSLKITKSERKFFSIPKFYRGIKSKGKSKKSDEQPKKVDIEISNRVANDNKNFITSSLHNENDYEVHQKDQQYNKGKTIPLSSPIPIVQNRQSDIKKMKNTVSGMISPPLSPNLAKMGLTLEKYLIQEGEGSKILHKSADKSQLLFSPEHVSTESKTPNHQGYRQMDVHRDFDKDIVSNSIQKKSSPCIPMPPIDENIGFSGCNSFLCSSMDRRHCHSFNPNTWTSCSMSYDSQSPNASYARSTKTSSYVNDNEFFIDSAINDYSLLDTLHKRYYPKQYRNCKFLPHEYSSSLPCRRRPRMGQGNIPNRPIHLETSSLDRKIVTNGFVQKACNDSLVTANPQVGGCRNAGNSVSLQSCVGFNKDKNLLHLNDSPLSFSDYKNGQGMNCSHKFAPNEKTFDLSNTRRRSLPSISARKTGTCIDLANMSSQPLSNQSQIVRRRSTDMHQRKINTNQREVAEIEAVEACNWLRAAGFPQYAQMYDDLVFPIEISSVEKDHAFLDPDSLQSLFRRLNMLNKCANMKIDTATRKPLDESDEDEQYALSDNWQYEISSKRWSRCDLDDHTPVHCLQSPGSQFQDENKQHQPQQPPIHEQNYQDSLIKHNDPSPKQLTSLESQRKSRPTDLKIVITPPQSPTEKVSFLTPPSSPVVTPTSPRFQRSSSERVKNSNSFLRRIESLTSSKRKKHQDLTIEKMDISSPVLIDSAEMMQRIDGLHCMDIPTSPTAEPRPVSGPRSYSRSSSKYHSDAEASPMLSKRAGRVFSDSSASSYYSAYSTLSDSGTDLERKLSQLQHDRSATKSESEIESDSSGNRSPTVLHTNTNTKRCIQIVNNKTMEKMSNRVDQKQHNNSHGFGRSKSYDSQKNLENRLSIYDNVCSSTDLNPTHELDKILQELLEDINGLSRTLGETETDEATLLQNLNSTQFHQNFDSYQQQLTCSGDLPKLDTIQDECFDLHINDSRGTVPIPVTIPENDQNSTPSTPPSEADISDIEIFEVESSKENEPISEKWDSSVTKRISDKSNSRPHWYSFIESHRPSFNSQSLQISSLSAGQLMVYHKLCLLKVTSLMEKYSPSNRTGWNWAMPKFIRRMKTPDYSDKNVFGVPLLTILQRTGQPLPKCILHAMRCLRSTAKDAVGIFRKSGVRSRIQKLRNEIEAKPDSVDFESLQAYDVADLVKQYFRELPECLLTNKLSETFISNFMYMPPEQRLDGIQAAVMLLPDENREVLQCLLLFLSDMAEYAEYNQMTASNLAVCFAPSLFQLVGCQRNSPKRSRKNVGVPDPRELQEQNAAHRCLTLMITQSKEIFKIPKEMLGQCRFSHIDQSDLVSFEELGRDIEGKGSYQTFIESSIQGLLKESRDKFKGWINLSLSDLADVSFKKIGDGHLLRLWKCSVDVEAPPEEVLNRVLRERHLWDEDLVKWKVVEKLDSNSEIFQYMCNSLPPHPSRDYTELRSWRTNLPKGACVLVSTSVKHPDAADMGGVMGVVLASHYLIEPCGSGKSRLTHIYRIDTRGRTPEWHSKVCGHLGIMYMSRIQGSFKKSISSSDSPETKL